MDLDCEVLEICGMVHAAVLPLFGRLGSGILVLSFI